MDNPSGRFSTNSRWQVVAGGVEGASEGSRCWHECLTAYCVLVGSGWQPTEDTAAGTEQGHRLERCPQGQWQGGRARGTAEGLVLREQGTHAQGQVGRKAKGDSLWKFSSECFSSSVKQEAKLSAEEWLWRRGSSRLEERKDNC